MNSIELMREAIAVAQQGLASNDVPVGAEQTARSLLNGSGEARDADVFSLGLLEEVRAAFPNDPAITALVLGAQRVRAQARHRNREMFSDRTVTRFALTVLYLCERLALHLKSRTARRSPQRATAARQALSSEPAAPRTASRPFPPEDPAEVAIAPLEDALRPYAFEHLLASWHRLERRMRKARSPQDWHRARLSAKNLRYALELTLPTLPKPRRMRLALRQLIKLQQRLGEEHDQIVGGAIAHRIAGEAQLLADEAQRATGLIEGWSARSATPPSDLHATARRIEARLTKLMAVLS